MSNAPRCGAQPSRHPATEATETTTSFADLGVSRSVAEALRMRGIAEPFPIQSLVLRDAIAGRDVLARSRTGSGQDARVRGPDRRAADARRREPDTR